MAVSFAKDIRPLIRNKDIECMKDYDIDLSNVGSVRKNSKLIYERLSRKEMPEDGPWPDANIAKFKQWMDEGMAE
ncbi:MAG TPA: hypothetical protein VFD70_21835 [Anaerolineae bacterium]|nr:hypothetical protein [Anaerolineae bacterium]